LEEVDNLKSQFAISSAGWGGRRKLPYVFTEHGAIMAAGVLNTPKALEVSVYVVRAFVRIREYLATHEELARKLSSLEKKYDALRRLMTPPEKPRRRISF
jgi:hypothetical protein